MFGILFYYFHFVFCRSAADLLFLSNSLSIHPIDLCHFNQTMLIIHWTELSEMKISSSFLFVVVLYVD